MSKLTKKKIITYLQGKGIYDDIDESLIDALLAAHDLAGQAKADIDLRGVVVDYNSAGTLKNSNPSVNIFLSASKLQLSYSVKLGLGEKARIDLKINVKEEHDGF
jgi:P27 family predicted phage terminase small subunit